MSYNCLCMFHNVTGFNCIYLGGRKGGRKEGRGGEGEYRTLCNSEGGRKEERREGGKERREGEREGRREREGTRVEGLPPSPLH